MTRRATVSQSTLDRASKVAAARGWGLVVTPEGEIILAPVEALPLPSREKARGNSCDEAFGTGS